MANKTLNLLTIGGVTMEIPNERLYQLQQMRFPTAWAWVDGPSITLSQGKWVIVGECRFQDASTTGQTDRGIAVNVDGYDISNQRATAPNNGYAIFNATAIVDVNGDVIAKIRAMSSRIINSNCHTTITAVKIS